MPNQDGTGPEGKGPKTGRMRGKCKDIEPRPIRNRCEKRNFRRRCLNENNEE